MTFFAEERAVSPVLGGILMFGLAMSLLILTQVSVVPAANQQVEFEHNLGVQEDFERFQGSATRVAASGATETVDIELGTRYPNRFFLVNPAPASGRLTTEPSNITISNVKATNPETAEYFASLDTPYTLEYDTNSLVYEPNYRQYGNAPRTVYENGLIYNQYDGDVTLLTSATPIVSDGDIRLVLLDGALNEQGTALRSLDLVPASAPATKLSVTPSGPDPMTMTLPTYLPESEWREAFGSQPNVDLDYTASAGSGPSTVTLTFAPGEVYTLTVARLAIGESPESRNLAYVTTVGSPQNTIQAETSITYTVEARDEQHNPVVGVDLTASVSNDPASVSNDRAFFDDGGSQTKQINVTTDETGRATVTVQGAIGRTGAVDVFVGKDNGRDGVFSDADEGPAKYVRYNLGLVSVTPRVSEVGDSINPGDDSDDLVFQTSTRDGSVVEMTFTYSGLTSKSIEAARVNYYFVGNPSEKNPNPSSINLNSANASTSANTSIGGVWTEFRNGSVATPISIAPGQTVLTADLLTPNGKYELAGANDEFFMLSLLFEDGSTKIYIIPVDGKTDKKPQVLETSDSTLSPTA
jgi:hypothetical protein